MISARQKGYPFKLFFLTNTNILLKAGFPLVAYLSSCQSPHYYRPKPIEPVLLTHSRQSKISMIADDDNFNAINIAYSPTAHLGVSAGAGFFSEDKKIGEAYFNPYLSAGYYKKLSLNTLIETYGGVGIYNYNNKDEVGLKKIKFYNYFVQPSFAFMRQNIEVVFTLRLDYLKRYNTTIDNNYLPDTADFRLEFLKFDNYLFFQPGCTVRVGFKYFKFQIQVIKSNPFNNKYASIYGTVYNAEIDTDVFDHPVKMSSGVTVDLDILKKANRKIPSKR